MKSRESYRGSRWCAWRENGEHILILVLLAVVIAFAVLLLLGLPQALDLAGAHANAAADWISPEHPSMEDPEQLRAERAIEWWL